MSRDWLFVGGSIACFLVFFWMIDLWDVLNFWGVISLIVGSFEIFCRKSGWRMEF